MYYLDPKVQIKSYVCLLQSSTRIKMKTNKTNGSGLKKLTNRKKKCSPQVDAPAEVLREPKNWMTSFSKLVKGCGTLRSQNRTIISNDKPPSSTSLCSSLPSVDKLVESKNEPKVETMQSNSLPRDRNLSTEPCLEVLDSMPEPNKHHQREGKIPEKVSEKNVALPFNNISLECNVTEKYVVVNDREKVVAVTNSGFSKPPLSMMNRNQSSGYRQYSQAGIKPRGVTRNVTENSNVSLHRRQQPLDPFEFDTASLRRIASTATDAFNEKESDMIALPKIIDFNMRAVSAMTTLSDEGDIDDLDADNYFAFDDDEKEEEDIRWTVSPTSVVDICQPPSGADAWMLEWATVPQSKDNELKLTQTLSTELNSTVNTMDCSESTVTLESSLTDPDDLQIDPVYVPTAPLPLKAASPIEGQIHFAGWVAVNAESCWIDNDAAKVSKEAVQFVQVISPIAGSEQEGNLLVRISTADDVKNISLCASTCHITTKLVSKRMGCCVTLTDGNVELCLLPVNVIPLRLLSKKRESKPDTTCEVLFMPFKKAFDSEEQYYAPDSQHDAVIHLSFSADIALRASCLR